MNDVETLKKDYAETPITRDNDMAVILSKKEFIDILKTIEGLKRTLLRKIKFT